MAYKKTTWVTGDVITADKLNNIEEGIESVSGSDSPNTKDIRDYLDTSMSQKGQKHITLRPDDFSELYADGKVLTPGSDDSIAVETTNSAWKIYKYELGRAFVLRVDQIAKNNSAAGCVPIAFRYKGVDYAVDYNRTGQYYLADTVLVSYNATNDAYAVEEFSFTETVRQEFSDSIICRDHAGEFDSLVVFGDSIFANTISNPDTGALTNNGNGVTKQLADLMGVPLYKHAVNNATLSTKYTTVAQNVVKQIQDYIANPDSGSRPLFIIEGGTNDGYHYGISNLGTYGSSDTTTIYGAIYYAINLLLSIEGVQPWQILVCTPIPKGIRALWDGTAGFSSAGWLANTDLELTTIGHAMYEIALNRQCSVINGYNAIFDELSSQYICQLMMGDDTHPTVYGSERYARYIYDTLFSGASTKEVENEISELKSAIEHDINAQAIWENGNINASDGAEYSSTSRMRTDSYIPHSVIRVSMESGYKTAIFAWDGTTYKGFWTGTEFSKGLTTIYHEGSIDILSIVGYNVRLVVGKTASGTTISPSDYGNVHLVTATDETLTKSGIPADAKQVGMTAATINANISELYDVIYHDKTLSSTAKYYCKPDGTLGYNASWKTLKAKVADVFYSDKLNGTGNTNYYSTTYPSIVYQDESGNVVGTVFSTQLISAIQKSSIPSGAFYININSETSFTVNAKSINGKIEILEEEIEQVPDNFNEHYDAKFYRNEYLFIKDGTVICSNSKISGTTAGAGILAKYCMAELDDTTSKIRCKFKYKAGTVTLITTNHKNKGFIDSIVKQSVHISYGRTNVHVGVFKNSQGNPDRLYELAIIPYSTELPTDGATEYEVGFDFLGNDTIRLYMPDGTYHDLVGGVSQTEIPGATYPDEEPEPGCLDSYNGKYVIYEIYLTGKDPADSANPTTDFNRPMFTGFYALPINGRALRDNFQRCDGNLTVAPSGHVYTLARNASATDSKYDEVNNIQG